MKTLIIAIVILAVQVSIAAFAAWLMCSNDEHDLWFHGKVGILAAAIINALYGIYRIAAEVEDCEP